MSEEDGTEEDKASNEDVIFFKCKFCETEKPISEMIVITSFFPQLVACADCRKKVESKSTSGG